MKFLQNLPTLRVSSVPKTYQLYAYLQFLKPTNFTRIFSCQNLPVLRVPSVAKTCQLYVYLPSPTPINFTCTSRLQHPEPMPRLPLVRQPYAGALSSDLRCQRLSDEWKPGHGFVRTRKGFARTRKGFIRIPKRSDLQ